MNINEKNIMKTYKHIISGLAVLVVILVIIGVAGYMVSKPKPMTIQGEAEAYT